MKVLAFTGWSGAGKTTLIAQVIRELVARGERVAAIKHTHHPLPRHPELCEGSRGTTTTSQATSGSLDFARDDTRKGDTAVFIEAGADPVLLVGDVENPRDLLHGLDVDYVLIEGFKSYHGWPRIEVTPEARPSPADVLAKLATIAATHDHR